MKKHLYQIAVVSTLASATAVNAEPNVIEALDPPERFDCAIQQDETKTYSLTWSEIRDAKKYAYELNCRVLTGETSETAGHAGWLSLKGSLKAKECEGPLCTTSLSETALVEELSRLRESGELVVPEQDNVFVACNAKVKGLNPPGPSQNHPQGIAACEQMQSQTCPAWTAEQLADIGSHGGLTIKDVENQTDSNWIGLYTDYEFGLSDPALDINVGAATGYSLNLNTYVALYYHGPRTSLEWLENTTSPDPENDQPSNLMEITNAEYEICKQQLINHKAAL